MAITSVEIAKLANVSRATVYRVVNNKPGVREDTQKIVQDIIDKYDYKPNIAGKALVKHRNEEVIGIILPSMQNDFYRQVKLGLDDAYKEYKGMGFRIIFKFMKDYSVQDQLESIEFMIEKKVNALCLVAIDNELVKKSLSKLANSIPIVTFISDINDVNKLCFVGNELEKSGRVAFELVSKLIRKDGNVAIITTALNLSAHKERLEGFQNKLEDKQSDINIVGVYENYDNDDRTYQIVEEIYKTQKSIDAIYMTTGLGTLGLGRALERYDTNNDVKVITCDRVKATRDLLKKGIIDFTICQDPHQEGYMPLKILFDYLIKSEKPITNQYYTKTDVRVWENI
jgi:LacI family transcriptional regulator